MMKKLLIAISVILLFPSLILAGKCALRINKVDSSYYGGNAEVEVAYTSNNSWAKEAVLSVACFDNTGRRTGGTGRKKFLLYKGGDIAKIDVSGASKDSCVKISAYLGTAPYDFSGAIAEPFACMAEANFTQNTSSSSSISGYRMVTRVVDGDTIVLDGNEKVRLIGVDTTEIVHPSKPVEYFSKEASEFTRSIVEGKRVRLEFDWQRTDKYGRTLAYVYLEGGMFVNLEIVRQGYGFAYTKYPFKYMEEFREAERQARESNRGLWK